MSALRISLNSTWWFITERLVLLFAFTVYSIIVRYVNWYTNFQSYSVNTKNGWSWAVLTGTGQPFMVAICLSTMWIQHKFTLKLTNSISVAPKSHCWIFNLAMLRRNCQQDSVDVRLIFSQTARKNQHGMQLLNWTFLLWSPNTLHGMYKHWWRIGLTEQNHLLLGEASDATNSVMCLSSWGMC